MKRQIVWAWAVALAAVLLPTDLWAQSSVEILRMRMQLWESKALFCDVGSQARKFPSKQTSELTQPCDDGDMTLFNGLLCAAGDQRGCNGVADAQDAKTGEWFRSPRIRLRGNDRGGASFSPDMALGVQLYLLTTKDTERALKWMLWLHDLVPCSIELGSSCLLQGIPRFCAPDPGCTMRPGDAGVLAQTVNYMQKRAGLPDLPHGRLKGYLGSFASLAEMINELDSQVNRPGYSQHLVAVAIMAMRRAEINDAKLQSAAARLAAREPNNAFFAFLKDGPTQRVLDQVLSRCPKADTVLIPPLHQWQWEREDADRAWESSAYWDCIFMGRLLLDG